MNTYIISYDLKNPGQNYQNLVKEIHSYSAWARLGGSTYVITTNDNVVTVRNNLLKVLDDNDKLFVGVINAPAAWFGLGEDVSDWLKNKLQ